MRVLYMVLTGAADPTRASIGLHLAANGSLETGQDVAVLFAGDGSDVLLGDAAATLQGVGVPAFAGVAMKGVGRAR